MGGCTFTTKAKGKNAHAAFSDACYEARHQHGHGGYTGTIAEKHRFTMIPLPAGQGPEDFAEQLIADDDPRINDKWGPAGCIDLGGDEYLFFGWAPS